MKKKAVSLLLTLVLALGLCTTSWAADSTYLDAAGAAQPIPAGTKTLTAADTDWSGWYVVDGNVTLTGTITVSGETHLILKDGCELTINGGIDCGQNAAAAKPLYIYGQRDGTGKLTIQEGFAWREHHYTGIYSSTEVVINGGIMTSTGKKDGTASFGININRLTVNGGTVTATGQNATSYSLGIFANTITINGGSVNATRGEAALSYGGISADTLTMTGGTLIARTTAANTNAVVLTGSGAGFSFTVPEGYDCRWRVTENGGYSGAEDWAADTFLSGAYAEIKITKPEPVKHYYYAPVEATEEAIEAPKTADPGVAVYGVLAAVSVLGMGVVKRKAF